VCYQSQGALAQAEPLFQKLVVIARDGRGEAHLEYWQALNSLLEFYSRKGAPQDVVEPVRARLREVEKAIRESKERTLEHAQWLMALAQGKRGPEAEEFLQPALAIYKETVGERAPQYIRALSLLGSATKDRRGAEAIQQRVLDLRKNTKAEGGYTTPSRMYWALLWRQA
jgi:tetratricopeptide (TPR) repeat protein